LQLKKSHLLIDSLLKTGNFSLLCTMVPHMMHEWD